MREASIRELKIMVDDKELTQPILILFSPPTSDQDVQDVIREYNFTNIIDKVRYQLAETTLVFLGLSFREMVVSLCLPIRCRPASSAGIWKVRQSYDRHRHSHESHDVNVGLDWLIKKLNL